MKDVLIIGAGPAGLTAAIYAIRAGLDCMVLEKLSPGGQVMNTFEVENYPGFPEPVTGWELMSKMEQQTKRLGVDIKSAEVKHLKKVADHFEVTLTDDSLLETKTVIAASGASLKTLGVPGESDFTGRGVSYCATCDGAFYKDKVTVVVGGGDTALEEAIFLTKFAKKVYLVHRRDEFRGTKILQDRVLSNDKIEPVYDSVVEKINGSLKLENVELLNVKTNEKSTLETDGVFIFVGYLANTTYLPSDLLNDFTEVKVDMNMNTAISGLYAAGDLRSGSKRQIVMAAADGATAAMEAYEHISHMGK